MSIDSFSFMKSFGTSGATGTSFYSSSSGRSSRSTQSRWSFDDLNSEKQYLDSVALKLMSSYASEYGYPASINVESPKKPAISQPHRIIDYDSFMNETQQKTPNSSVSRMSKKHKKKKRDIESVIFSDSDTSDNIFDFNDNINDSDKKVLNEIEVRHINRNKFDPKRAKHTVSLVQEDDYQQNRRKTIIDDESDDIDDFVDDIHTYTRWK